MWEIQIFGFEIYYIFYNFFLYSFFGWIYESTLVSVKNRRWINRGFLNGPIIPIYGAGATIVYLCVSQMRDNTVFVFLNGVIIATALEYITSYVMEHLFHAKWWDYSHTKFNIKGRICLHASLFWGFLSILMTKILQPCMDYLISIIPYRLGKIGGVVIVVIFLLDLGITVVNTIQLDHTLARMQRIREELSEYLEEYFVHTKFYAAKEEWKNRMEQYSFLEWIEQTREVLGEKKKTVIATAEESEREEKKSIVEELENRLKGFTEKYQVYSKKKGYVKRRILKAFPHMKIKNRENVLQELKGKMFEKQKDKTSKQKKE